MMKEWELSRREFLSDSGKLVVGEALLSRTAAAFPRVPQPGWLKATTKSRPKPFDVIEWNGGKFLYGVDYYPDAWDKSRLEKDLPMMQEAGIKPVTSVVRELS